MAIVLHGVTGSIAAYKAADLVSRLTQRGHEVHVVMTRSATELVKPRTFSALSRMPVHTDLWDPAENRLTEHISLAELPDIVVIAPATANTIGKAAHGIADEILSTTLLAVTVPVIIAPASTPYRDWHQCIIGVRHNPTPMTLRPVERSPLTTPSFISTEPKRLS